MSDEKLAGLTRYSGTTISNSYVLESEEFFLARKVESILATTTSTEPVAATDSSYAASFVLPPTRGTVSQRDALYMAAIHCGHKIDEDTVTLYRNTKLDGNALSQLADRLAAASASPVPRAQGGNTCNETTGSSPADAGGLTRYDCLSSGMIEWESGDWVKLADVESLFATKAAQMEVLAKALEDIEQPANAGCGCDFPCRCDSPEAEAINADSMRDIAHEALKAVYGASPAPSAKQEPSGWQGMGTAPADGTEILIRYPLQGNVKRLAHYSTVYGSWMSKDVAIFPAAQGCEWTHLPSDAAPSASASPAAPTAERIKVDYAPPFGKRGWVEVFGHEFAIEGASEHRFAVHNSVNRIGEYTATHIETGFAIDHGETPEEAIEHARAKWAKATPEERAEKMERAKSLTSIVKGERAKPDAIGADSIFPEFIESPAASPAAAVAAPAPAPVAGSQQVTELSDEQIEPEARKYALYVRPNGDLDQPSDYDVTRYECREDFFNCVRACIALAAAAPAVPVPVEPQLVPEGYAIVPLEPTPEMVNAPNTIIQAYGAKLIYQRMVAAAPSLQQPKEGAAS